MHELDENATTIETIYKQVTGKSLKSLQRVLCDGVHDVSTLEYIHIDFGVDTEIPTLDDIPTVEESARSHCRKWNERIRQRNPNAVVGNDWSDLRCEETAVTRARREIVRKIDLASRFRRFVATYSDTLVWASAYGVDHQDFFLSDSPPSKHALRVVGNGFEGHGTAAIIEQPESRRTAILILGEND